MPRIGRRHKLRLSLRSETGEPDEDDSCVQPALTEHEFPEVLVGRQRNRILIAASPDNCLVISAGINFGDKQHIVAFGAKPVCLSTLSSATIFNRGLSRPDRQRRREAPRQRRLSPRG
jgi:hypothetical protein